jgi:hypothetical protein
MVLKILVQFGMKPQSLPNVKEFITVACPHMACIVSYSFHLQVILDTLQCAHKKSESFSHINASNVWYSICVNFTLMVHPRYQISSMSFNFTHCIWEQFQPCAKVHDSSSSLCIRPITSMVEFNHKHDLSLQLQYLCVENVT